MNHFCRGLRAGYKRVKQACVEFLNYWLLVCVAECRETCSSCSGPEANQCTQCEKGLVLDPNTLLCGVTGDTDCPPRTYLHDDQFTCMGCHRHCYSCEGPGKDTCLTCAIPAFLYSEQFPGLLTHKCCLGVDQLQRNLVKAIISSPNRIKIYFCQYLTVLWPIRNV